jgi:hypothetical protein
MVSKNPILAHRVRNVPAQFSWLDHRLVRERYIDRCTHAAAALYLFLVTVADAAGMSYYGDASIGRRLSMDLATLEAARDNLVRIGLIAWQKPLYQVLSFKERSDAQRASMAQPASLADIFKKAAAGGAL